MKAAIGTALALAAACSAGTYAYLDDKLEPRERPPAVSPPELLGLSLGEPAPPSVRACERWRGFRIGERYREPIDRGAVALGALERGWRVAGTIVTVRAIGTIITEQSALPSS